MTPPHGNLSGDPVNDLRLIDFSCHVSSDKREHLTLLNRFTANRFASQHDEIIRTFPSKQGSLFVTVDTSEALPVKVIRSASLRLFLWRRYGEERAGEGGRLTVV